MTGRHSAQPTASAGSGRLRRVLPAIAGTAVAAVLIGGAIAAVNLKDSGTAPNALASSIPADQGDIDRDADRNADRADRGEGRESPPAPSPSSAAPAAQPPTKAASKSPAASPSPKRSSSAPSGTGNVTSTGTCQASYYDTGTTTASGEHFDPDGITAAHKTLPFNTKVRVTNLANNSSVTARVNDRGPFVEGRCIDLSRGAFKAIASLGAGVLSIRYEVLA